MLGGPGVTFPTLTPIDEEPAVTSGTSQLIMDFEENVEVALSVANDPSLGNVTVTRLNDGVKLVVTGAELLIVRGRVIVPVSPVVTYARCVVMPPCDSFDGLAAKLIKSKSVQACCGTRH